MQIEDILDSDQKILAHSTRVQEKDTTLLTFDWGDGSQPLKGVLPEKLDAAILVEWCTAVRRAHNARENGKAITKASQAAAVRGPHEQANPSAGIGSGGGLPVKEGIEGVKAALVSGIESALAEVGRRKEDLARKLAESKLVTIAHEAELTATHELEKYYLELKGKL